MTDPLDEFARAARAYCAWTVSPPGDETAELRAALHHLSRLYTLALDLDECSAEDIDADRPDDRERWKAVFRRTAALPFQYYGSALDPHAVDRAEITIDDLADDLADIDRDLSDGLNLFDRGHREAAEWTWAFHFRIHWGHHAVSALQALHHWCEDEKCW